MKSIIGTRHRGRAKRYITEWEGGAVTIEPESSFDSQLVTVYHLKVYELKVYEPKVYEPEGIRTKVYELKIRIYSNLTFVDWLRTQSASCSRVLPL